MRAIDEIDGKLRILDEIIEKNSLNKVINNAAKFKYIVYDEKTVMKLKRIASRVNLKQPVLIEGKTGTSKTSMIEYLAYLTNNKIIKLNLSALTDTSDLIGKFVPNDGLLDINDLNISLLKDKKSKEIVENCKNENRKLTKHESLLISNLENITIPEWKWLYGAIPLAMMNGYWVILDEINLASPNILERLNSLLEFEPSLRISEYNDIVISENGDIELNDNFRIFATMNPTEYEGRNELSEAYLDRWQGYLYFDDIQKKEYYDMIMYMIKGYHPKIINNGITYDFIINVNPPFPILSKIDNIKLFVEKLVDLHEDIFIKKNKELLEFRSRIILTRRTLISVINFMAKKVYYSPVDGVFFDISSNISYIVREALVENYVMKAQNREDKDKIWDIIEMSGILSLNLKFNM